MALVFRDIEADDQYWLVVTSDEDWQLVNRTIEDDSFLHEELLENLNVADGDSNELMLIAQNEVGFFFVNGRFIDTLDLSERLDAGDISTFTAFYIGNLIEGRTTHLQTLQFGNSPKTTFLV